MQLKIFQKETPIPLLHKTNSSVMQVVHREVQYIDKGKKRKYKAKKKYLLLCDYLSKNEKYKNQFLLALEYDLNDFAIILAWKTLMLFLYEKIYQITRIVGFNEFLKLWKNKFSNQRLKQYKPENLYWPNQEDDDKILSLLDQLYPIDSNFIKQLRILKSKRDISAHVADDKLNVKYHQLKSYLTDLVENVENIQQHHERRYLDTIKIKDNIDIVKRVDSFLHIQPSPKEKDKFLDWLIAILRNVSSFREAENYEDMILKFRYDLTPFHIEKILAIVFENPQQASCGINQILLASKTPDFLHELHKISKLRKVSGGKWKAFYRKFLELYKGNAGIFEMYKCLDFKQ